MTPIPFFESPARQASLKAELESWKGTRFLRGCGGLAQKQIGADCASFVETVYRNLRAIQPIVWPRYTTHHGGEEMLDLLFKTLAGIPNMSTIWLQRNAYHPTPPLLPGDLFVRSAGADYHHLAIYSGQNTLWNIREHKGVCTANIHDLFAMKTLRAIYRIYEEGGGEGRAVKSPRPKPILKQSEPLPTSIAEAEEILSASAIG